ncbi:MAG: hypothetical protein AVDCRST_MAG32-1184, partial [uncultured Nocardioides sp.]
GLLGGYDRTCAAAPRPRRGCLRSADGGDGRQGRVVRRRGSAVAGRQPGRPRVVRRRLRRPRRRLARLHARRGGRPEVVRAGHRLLCRAGPMGHRGHHRDHRGGRRGVELHVHRGSARPVRHERVGRGDGALGRAGRGRGAGSVRRARPATRMAPAAL